MITREQIKKTLDEIYDAEYGDGETPLRLADGIDFWLQNGEYPFDVIETIVDAVYELSGKPRSALGWHAEPLRDEWSYTGRAIEMLASASERSGRRIVRQRPLSASTSTKAISPV
jgi:hypothetical protein